MWTDFIPQGSSKLQSNLNRLYYFEYIMRELRNQIEKKEDLQRAKELRSIMIDLTDYFDGKPEYESDPTGAA